MSEFPYQIVAFLDREPRIGEPVYEGKNGWYPQIALKRRFRGNDLTEDELVKKIDGFFSKLHPLVIQTGGLVKPERMPVQVIEIRNPEELMTMHLELVDYLSDEILSRYPERDGKNYYPHITAEYDSKMVIDVDQYTNKEFTLNSIWLLKDNDQGDSVAIHQFHFVHPSI